MMASGSANLRDFPGEPVGDDRALVPVRVVDDAARAACAPAWLNLLHLVGALGGLLLERRREQLLDRRDQVVEPVADVGDTSGTSVSMTLPMLQWSMRMSMNFGPRGTIGAGPLCWSLLPTLMTTSASFG